jgi:hypothetical protein
MENKELLEQLKQHEENIRSEVKNTGKRIERNTLAYVITAAILLYFLLK